MAGSEGRLTGALSRLLSGKKPRDSHLLMAPTALWLVAFLVVPMILIVALSFTIRGDYGKILWRFTLSNYSRALTPAYFPILLRSLTYASATTLLCLALGYPFAYTMTFFVKGRRGVLILLLMLPFWTSCLIAIYSWMIVLGREGLLNTFLLRLGALHQPLQILNTPAAVILGLVYFYLPFMILPLYGSLEKIPPSYLEAAKDLGASPAQTFLRVTFPLSLPGVFAGCILTFIPCVGDFLVAEFMGGPGTYLLGNLISSQFGGAQDWPFGSAMAALLVLVLVGGMTVYQRVEGAEVARL